MKRNLTVIAILVLVVFTSLISTGCGKKKEYALQQFTVIEKEERDVILGPGYTEKYYALWYQLDNGYSGVLQFMDIYNIDWDAAKYGFRAIPEIIGTYKDFESLEKGKTYLSVITDLRYVAVLNPQGKNSLFSRPAISFELSYFANLDEFKWNYTSEKGLKRVLQAQ